MSTVCVDTQIMIWGVKNESNEGQEEMVRKARGFIEWLDKTKTKVIVPSVVLAELLVPIPESEHMDFISKMSRSFSIAPFDAYCAVWYAKIWQKKKSSNAPKPASREVMKADFQIVATAKANKVSCIYSHDSDVLNYSDGIITASQMPNIPTQMKMSDPTKEKKIGENLTR